VSMITDETRGGAEQEEEDTAGGRNFSIHGT
jgi:hypothetical protein